MKFSFSVLACAVSATMMGSAANAAFFQADSGNLHATATVTVEANDIKVVLTNTTTGTHSAADTLTAFSFNGIGDLTILHQPGDTSAVTLRTITNGDPIAFTDAAGGVGDVGWHISDPKGFGPSLNFAAPDQAIVSNDYAANGVTASLTGNHNPLILTTGTWYLSKGNFTSDADITGVDFRFGTDLETDLPPGGGDTPEPASLGLLSIGVIGLLARRRQR